MLAKFVIRLKDPSCKVSEDDLSDPSLIALASLLQAFATRKHFSFQVKLSVSLHGLTRMHEIIDLMKIFSFGVSYKDVLHLYELWTEEDLKKREVCPTELAEGLPGSAILDNDDFSVWCKNLSLDKCHVCTG